MSMYLLRLVGPVWEAILYALRLSTYKIGLGCVCGRGSSARRRWSQSVVCVASEQALYSASQVDVETVFWRVDVHVRGELFKRVTVPVMDRRVVGLFA